MNIARAFSNSFFRLSLITMTAVLVHGYHLGADDAAIYVPGIKKAANPALFPTGTQFFMSHAHLSLFSNVVGGSARVTRLPTDLIIFLWHILSIFLLLLASYRLLCCCFESARAIWAGVALVAAVLCVPVAGTALLIMDPYLTARSLSTPATIFAITACIAGQWKRAVSWLFVTALIHPQMAVYGAMFLLLNAAARASEKLPRSLAEPGPAFYAGLPFVMSFEPATGAAREALFSRPYFFVFNWTWYEWFGVFAPLALLWWFSISVRRNTTPLFAVVCRTLVPFGLLATAAGVFLEMSPKLENFARLQPMRSLHLVYVIFFALLGGILGEYVLKTSIARWVGLFACLALSMWLVESATYPGSPHLEWPGSTARNAWISAFLWIRDNTPRNALFALDPRYMLSPGEDEHGFRAIAERSSLADDVKDEGAVSLFPGLALEWKAEVQAETREFAARDFDALAKQYHVTWFVTTRPTPTSLTCPYRNQELLVCHVR